MFEEILKKIGLSDKETRVYLAALKLGPSPVRKIAVVADVNRGTAYDILKSLIAQGLVSYYHKEKNQYFVAEDPEKLTDFLESKKNELNKTKEEICSIIPQLKSIHDNAGDKPVVKYYEGSTGIKTVLTDVIETCINTGEMEYYVYSSSTIKEHLYKSYKNFTEDRIKAGLKVKTISIGPGGDTKGLDERKWLSKDESSPTYTLIYGNKMAMISVDSNGRPIGVIVEDKNIYLTQIIIFESLWNSLKQKEVKIK
jgi:HTH-type transcriptional regulator, sugar sensing transcriptional regulator